MGYRECSYCVCLGKVFFKNKIFLCVVLYYEYFIINNLWKLILDNIGICIEIIVLNIWNNFKFCI